MADEESEPYEAGVEVKQGCAMDPVLFNIYLTAVNIIFPSGMTMNTASTWLDRLDGSLINLDRLKYYIKVKHKRVIELQ